MYSLNRLEDGSKSAIYSIACFCSSFDSNKMTIQYEANETCEDPFSYDLNPCVVSTRYGTTTGVSPIYGRLVHMVLRFIDGALTADGDDIVSS